MCPCIANIFSEYKKQDATFLKFIYSQIYLFWNLFIIIIIIIIIIRQTVTATCC